MAVNDNPIKLRTITRKQLRALGLSQYHSKTVTKSLSPLAFQQRRYIYDLSMVVISMREYLERPRIKIKTRVVCEQVLNSLTELLGNKLPVAFGESKDKETSRLAKELLLSMARTNTELSKLKLEASEISLDYAAQDS